MKYYLTWSYFYTPISNVVKNRMIASFNLLLINWLKIGFDDDSDGRGVRFFGIHAYSVGNPLAWGPGGVADVSRRCRGRVAKRPFGSGVW